MNIPKDSPFLLLLDFDGVICDSAMECFVSSWRAFRGISGLPADIDAPVDLPEEFLSLRPFIRTGEDFVLIQEILQRGIPVHSQMDFDGVAAGKSEAELREYRKRFYEARTNLLVESREYWLELNMLYSHMKTPLKTASGSDGLRIISTKKPCFIVEILKGNGIFIPESRVYLAPKEGKLPLAAELVEDSELDTAVLIDDQIDHITGNNRKDIQVGLATWGYVKKEWFTRLPPTVSLVKPEDMRKLFDAFGKVS